MNYPHESGEGCPPYPGGNDDRGGSGDDGGLVEPRYPLAQAHCVHRVRVWGL